MPPSRGLLSRIEKKKLESKLKKTKKVDDSSNLFLGSDIYTLMQRQSIEDPYKMKLYHKIEKLVMQDKKQKESLLGPQLAFIEI